MRSRLTLGLGSTEEHLLVLKMMNRVIAEMRTCPNGFEPERTRNECQQISRVDSLSPQNVRNARRDPFRIDLCTKLTFLQSMIRYSTNPFVHSQSKSSS